MKRTLISAALVIVAMYGCSWIVEMFITLRTVRTKLDFSELVQADTITIKTPHDAITKVIVDEIVVDEGVRFFVSHESGWGSPYQGPPIAPIGIEISAQGKVLGVNRKRLLSVKHSISHYQLRQPADYHDLLISDT